MSFHKNKIEENLRRKGLFPEVLVLPQTTSTNDVARTLLEEKVGDYLIAADQQTKGKGSHGRSFFSPDETGFYLTFTVPAADPETQMTLAAGVASVAAIEEVYGIHVGLKWVNDLQKDGKKVGGILCERVSSGTVIVGIGINLRTPKNGFPEEISLTAGALEVDVESASELAAAIYGHFFLLVRESEKILTAYKKMCVTLGTDICYVVDGRERQGKAIDVEEDGALLVLEEGKVHRYSTGDISVRSV
ncbi:MAG: biotin--[Oscillospiraceae bacterium]|nr:biotin--[acetyl-CoA-carboxylase] ligase [Oscillospiraceae bacterium]